jgi:hypothetical protein
LIVESKSRDGKEVYPHVRFRRVSVHYWTVEMPTKNRWEPVFLFEKGLLKDNIQLIIEKFPWTLELTKRVLETNF